MDAINELVSLGLGRSAEVLNLMLNSHIELSAPVVQLLNPEELKEALANGPELLSAVAMHYGGSMSGVAELIFGTGQAGRLVDCITGEDHGLEEGLDALRAGALCEVGNIVINAMMGAISNELQFSLDYNVPTYLEGGIGSLMAEARLSESQAVLLAKTVFNVQSLQIEGEIAIFMSMASLHFLEDALERYVSR